MSKCLEKGCREGAGLSLLGYRNKVLGGQAEWCREQSPNRPRGKLLLMEKVGVGRVLRIGFLNGSLHTAVQCILCSKAVFFFFFFCSTSYCHAGKKLQRHYFANKVPSSQSYGFSSKSCMDVRVGLWRKLSAEELMLLNCGVGEDSWESPGL